MILKPSSFTLPGHDAKLFPDQLGALQCLHDHGKLFGIVGVGGGKAQPVSEPVLTPKGWIPIGNLKVGDEVIGSDGHPTKVQGIFHQGEKEVWKVTFSDGSFTRCCDEHLWVTRKDACSPWKVRTLASARALKRLPYVPVVEAVQFTRKELPLDPYVLGVFLGDGTSSSLSPSLSNTCPAILKEFASRLPDGCVLSGSSLKDHSISHPSSRKNDFRAGLEELGLYGKLSDEKFVPEIYMLGSEEQRLDLLHGLLDSDGCVARNKASFSSTSPHLANAVVDLTRSLGGVASLSERQTYHTYKGEKKPGKPSFRVYVKLPPGVPYFKCRSVIPGKSTKYAEPVKRFKDFRRDGKEECVCISVAASDSLYVTRGYTLTHNTLVAMLAPRALDMDPSEAIIIATADLIKEAEREYKKYRAMGFDVCSPDYISYSYLSRNPKELERRNPRLIICDEVHKLRNPKAQRVRGFTSYMRQNPDVVFVSLTGTITTSSIMDYAHLLRMCVGEDSPLPNPNAPMGWSRLQSLSRVIDATPVIPPSAMDYSIAEYILQAGADETVRDAYHRLLRNTPGVYFSELPSYDGEIIIRKWKHDLPIELQSFADDVKKTGKLPNEEYLSNVLTVGEKQRQLATGFYYYPDIDPDLHTPQWVACRRAVNDLIGNVVERENKRWKHGVYTTEAKARAAYRAGELTSPLWDKWEQNYEHIPTPEKLTKWLDYDVLRLYTAKAEELAKELEGPILLWYQHDAVKMALEELGVFVVQEGDAPPRGEDVPPVVAVSIWKHATGLNLQEDYAGMVLLQPPSNGGIWEQLLGRLARPGFRSEELHVVVNQSHSVWRKGLSRGMRDAKYCEETLKQPHRLFGATLRKEA